MWRSESARRRREATAAALEPRVGGQERAGVRLRHLHEARLLLQVGDAEPRQARLRRADHVARAADGEVLLGDAEAVLGLPQEGKAALGRLAQGRLVEENAGRLGRAPPHPAAELVELCEAEGLGPLDVFVVGSSLD